MQDNPTRAAREERERLRGYVILEVLTKPVANLGCVFVPVHRDRVVQRGVKYLGLRSSDCERAPGLAREVPAVGNFPRHGWCSCSKVDSSSFTVETTYVKEEHGERNDGRAAVTELGSLQLRQCAGEVHERQPVFVHRVSTVAWQNFGAEPALPASTRTRGLVGVPGGRRAEGRRRGLVRGLWAAAILGFVASFLLAGVLVTVRTTALDADWYRAAIDDSHTYDRIYNRVLTDPAVARETRDLLAGLPIDHSLVAANARIVLPPATMREIVDRTVVGLVAYLRADRTTFDPVYALTPIFDNIRNLADQYLSDSITNLHPLQSNNLDEFGVNVLQFANDLGAGRRPASLPTIPLTGEQAVQLTEVLLDPIPVAQREALRLPVGSALAAGDLNAALATLAPEYARDNTNHVIVDLQQDAHGTHLHVDETLSGTEDSTIVIDMRGVRFLTGTVLPLITVGAVLVAVGSLWAIGALARRSGRRASITIAVTVLCAGFGLVAVFLVGRHLMGDPFSEVFGRSSVPPELHALLRDVVTRLFDSFDRTLVKVFVLPMVVAALVLGWTVAAPWASARVRLGGTSRRRLVVASGAITVVVALLGAWFLVPRSESSPRRCDGHVELCARSYDDVAFSESHNAMSASDLMWLGANQDVPITAQLDAGVRVLHIDTRYWETPVVTAKFAASLPPQQAAFVLAAAAGANPVKPGVWLCHALCRLGATKLDAALRQILRWVQTHPDDVLTLDIEDQTSAADTVAVFRQAGLARYTYTPGAPDQAWPTLGEMLDSGRRVVVFAERHGGTPAWYSPLYRYAMETPFTFRSATAFSCAPKRGGTGKRLFVMNHFITRAAPSRSDAAVVNARAAIVARARRCERSRGRLPNFVQVDFATLGDVNGAIDKLNGIG